MKHEFTKWNDRRSAEGTQKPLLFLFLEITLLVLLCWISSSLDMVYLTMLMVAVAGYFFFTSSFYRYKQVLRRQKFSHYD